LGILESGIERDGVKVLLRLRRGAKEASPTNVCKVYDSGSRKKNGQDGDRQAFDR
jgi:hypothetical protein